MRADPFDVRSWPFEESGVRVLPVLHGRLEFARAVRAHVDALAPAAIVLELPRALGEGFKAALGALPRISALLVTPAAGPSRTLLVEPTDALAEAGRLALERGLRLAAADLLEPRYPEHAEPWPDPAAIPEIGLASYLRACLERPAARDAADARREAALAAAAAEEARRGGPVLLVTGLVHVPGVLEALAGGAAHPLARPGEARVEVAPVNSASLVEVFSEAPVVAAAWERARGGAPACAYVPPEEPPKPGRVLAFPGAGETARRASERSAAARDAGDEAASERAEERACLERGEDPLGRARLLYRALRDGERFARESGGSEPTRAELRVLLRYARQLALVEGRLVPSLFDLVVAARGSVDDAFARDLLRLAGHWPWPWPNDAGIRLTPEDLGQGSRLVRLRPRIDRLAERPQLREALEKLAGPFGPGALGLCSHVPEDLLIEGLGADLRRMGGERASRAGVRVQPFSASLLDGLDARETLRRFVGDGRPWVREELPARAEVGAVVIVFDEEEDLRPGQGTRYPWEQVWHGEHEEESDMAFYATDPSEGPVAPGIHRAEYGGLLMIWPPWRLGDVWSDPAYTFCRTRAEVLLVAGLDYSETPLVVYVAPKAPGSRLLSLARHLGRRIVHVPPGTLSRDTLRRIRRVHVLADRDLRPIAERIIDPP